MTEKKLFNILFVCTGNTCRSPMAEGFLKYLLQNQTNINISSAGTSAILNEPANQSAITVMNEINIDISNYQSKPITLELLEYTNLILAMTNHHRETIIYHFPSIMEYSFLLSDYASNGKIKREISDPYGGTLEIYRNAREEIIYYLEMAKDKIIETIV